MDEPTNYLTATRSGAACAVKEFDGGVLLIRTTASLRTRSRRRREVSATARCTSPARSGTRQEDRQGEAVEQLIADEVVDALGNVVKVKAPRRSLRKEIKAKAKARATSSPRARTSHRPDWDLDEYIGETKETKTKAK